MVGAHRELRLRTVEDAELAEHAVARLCNAARTRDDCGFHSVASGHDVAGQIRPLTLALAARLPQRVGAPLQCWPFKPRRRVLDHVIPLKIQSLAWVESAKRGLKQSTLRGLGIKTPMAHRASSESMLDYSASTASQMSAVAACTISWDLAHAERIPPHAERGSTTSWLPTQTSWSE